MTFVLPKEQAPGARSASQASEGAVSASGLGKKSLISFSSIPRLLQAFSLSFFSQYFPRISHSRGHLLLKYTMTPIYDVLACGFGPASLALAIALVEPSTRPVPTFSSLGGLQEALLQGQPANDAPVQDSRKTSLDRLKPLRTCFIEKHDKFKWHPGMMLEGSNMQICELTLSRSRRARGSNSVKWHHRLS